MTTRPQAPKRFRRLSGFFRNHAGVAATEFALLAPLLVLLLGVTVELSRMMMAYRQFETAVIGVSRHIVRYPEYEKRARDIAPSILSALFPAGDRGDVNLVVNSLVKENGAIKEVFPAHVLFGTNPGIAWQSHVKAADFVDAESVVFVGASYEYQPMISFVPAMSLTFKKDFIILPSFGRSFPWNDNEVADKYVY